MVRHLPSTIPHTRCSAHSRYRLHRHAPFPNLRIRCDRRRILSYRRKQHHILECSCSGRGGRWLAHPVHRKYPLDALFHVGRGFAHAPHFQLHGHRRSHTPGSPTPTHSVYAQYGGKRLQCWLRRTRGSWSSGLRRQACQLRRAHGKRRKFQGS